MLGALGDAMLYHPARYPDGPWESQQSLGAEDVWLTAADGKRIHGWFVPAASGMPPQQNGDESSSLSSEKSGIVTLYLHGNAGNISHRGDKLSALAQAGTSVLIIDYRGFGKSDGRPNESGLYLDADAAYGELLRRGYLPEQIMLYGESLGTGVATDLAVRDSCAALVLEAPFPSIGDVASRVVPVLGPLVVSGFETGKKIGGVTVPILVIHGNLDEVVPYDLGQAVFAAANEPKQFWTIEGGHHNDLVQVAGAEFTKRLTEFFRAAREVDSPE
jgi:pimeloyl-ACP methyl ester carboxylesterase